MWPFWVCLAFNYAGFVLRELKDPKMAFSIDFVHRRYNRLIPNTYRRRRRDSTVELSCVGVASASAVCIEFATSSRRLPTKIWKLDMLRIYPVELSWVELCRRCVRARRLSWHSLKFCSVYVSDCGRKLETGSRLTTGAFTPPKRRNSTSLSANCSDSSRLVETVAN